MNNTDIYTSTIEKCDRFECKGKNMRYTSANGHMFSQVNKAGEIGIRFSKKTQEQYFEKFDTTYFTSYGATMKGYILIPDTLLENQKLLIDLLNESYDYVMSLDPK